MSDQQPEPINGDTGTPGTGSAASSMSAPAEPVAAAAEVEAPRLSPEQEETSAQADAPKVEATKVEPAKPEAAPPRTYVVKPGDSLSVIAHKFKVSVPALTRANGISQKKPIRPGQKLVIPE